MIILTALFILTAASVAILKWLEIGPFEQSEAADDEDKVKVKPRVPIIALDMETIQFPLVQGDGMSVTAQVLVKIETEGIVNADLIKKAMPKIHHAYLLDLYGFLPRLLKNKGRISGTILKQRLQTVGERIIGKGLIKSIIVQSQIDKLKK
tara:strand:- start:887 stop:1339 length:453 start_codon:yes stop_codon:yes gene_type:complete